MPRIPDESFSPKTGKKVTSQIEIKENKSKNPKKILDYAMALVIFLASFIEIFSFFKPDSNNNAIITNYGDYYLVFWFPLFASLELFVFSLFFIFKSFRYTSCLSTKIISILFSFVQVISITSLLIPCTVMMYITFLQPILLSVVILLISINLIKWFSK